MTFRVGSINNNLISIIPNFDEYVTVSNHLCEVQFKLKVLYLDNPDLYFKSKDRRFGIQMKIQFKHDTNGDDLSIFECSLLKLR